MHGVPTAACLRHHFKSPTTLGFVGSIPHHVRLGLFAQNPTSLPPIE